MSKKKSSLTDEEFKLAIEYAVAKYGVRAVTVIFGVSKETVESWLKGENFSYPAKYKGAMELLKKLAQEAKQTK